MTAPDALIHDPHPLPAELWERIAAHPRRLLMLDYDGTLASFAVDRMAARPGPGTLARVAAIAAAGDTRVAIVSGRPVEELDVLLGELPLVDRVYEHGWDERFAGAELVRHPVPAEVAESLEAALSAARACVWAQRVEHKRASIVLHTRGLDPATAAAYEAEATRLWSAAIGGRALVLDAVHGGVELRATARNKGSAVAELMARAPAGTLPVYVGDDRTDESAFDRVRPVGVTVCVCSARPSRAEFRVGSPAAVAAFLRRWPGPAVRGASGNGVAS
jgi:trehalose 6-phosphate phosphatase